MTCAIVHVIDYDSLDCVLEDGHAGPHKARCEAGDVWWQKDLTRRQP